MGFFEIHVRACGFVLTGPELEQILNERKLLFLDDGARQTFLTNLIGICAQEGGIWW